MEDPKPRQERTGEESKTRHERTGEDFSSAIFFTLIERSILFLERSKLHDLSI